MTTPDENDFLDKEFDFTTAVKNPYAKELKQQVTIKLSPSVVEYFKGLAAETAIPYQTLINMYLMDCVKHKRAPGFLWS